MAIGFISLLGINQGNASVKSIDGQNATSSFSDILAASISGGKIKYNKYQKGKAVTPDQGLWKSVCQNQCSAVNCGNESSLSISYEITPKDIQMGRAVQGQYLDGAACVSLCPAETIKYCKSAYASNYAKTQTPDKLNAFARQTMGLIIKQAGNLATAAAFKSAHPGSDELYFQIDPVAISEINTLFNGYVSKIPNAVKTLKG